MGLENFTSSTTEESNSIKTRKKLKNVNFEREFFENMIASDPGMLESAAHYTGDSSVKAMVQRMDEIIDEGLEGHNISEELEEEIENTRDSIVEEHL